MRPARVSCARGTRGCGRACASWAGRCASRSGLLVAGRDGSAGAAQHRAACCAAAPKDTRRARRTRAANRPSHVCTVRDDFRRDLRSPPRRPSDRPPRPLLCSRSRAVAALLRSPLPEPRSPPRRSFRAPCQSPTRPPPGTASRTSCAAPSPTPRGTSGSSALSRARARRRRPSSLDAPDDVRAWVETASGGCCRPAPQAALGPDVRRWTRRAPASARPSRRARPRAAQPEPRPRQRRPQPAAAPSTSS